MKNKLMLVLCGAAVLCSALLSGCSDKQTDSKPAGGTGTVQPVQWVKARDWTTTDSGTNYAIEFGFRPDGVLLWRKGDKL